MHKRLVALFALAASGLASTATAAPAAQALRPWTDYRVILWVGDSVWKQPAKVPRFFERLREMGVNTTMVYGDGDPRPALDQGFPYYVENIINKGLCLKWNSNVRDWDKFVTTWTETGRPESAFIRDYSLDDPQWRAWARSEMQRVAGRNAPHQPLAYDIRDELSTTISANPFDYDFSPLSLARFREWLKGEYHDLAALNAEWETQFPSWETVKPFTTDQIKNRMASGDALPRGKPDWQAVQRLQFDPVAARQQPTRWNFAPWCDFRTYMDVALSGVLDDLRQVSHATDPRTPVGIEGTQMPNAFGGYDLWLLAQVLDWVEPYDIGNAREIFGSFMPGKPFLTTVFEKDTRQARRRLWHLLLEGDRGCIVWWSEDCIDWQSPDYALTAKAKALAPVLKEMTSPLAQLFLCATKEYDPIGIHYSQASIQVDWLLESTVDGATWHRRFSSFEADHNRLVQVRNSWLKAFQDLGYSPRFVSSHQVEQREWTRAPGQVMVLPNATALGGLELAALAGSFSPALARPAVGTVFFDGTPGLFDQHGRLRAEAPAFAPEGKSATSAQRSFVSDGQREDLSLAGDIATYARNRLRAEPQPDWLAWIARHLPAKAPVQVRLASSKPEGAKASSPSPRTRIHRYTLGRARLLAFERNIDYQMSEDLRQAGGNEALEKTIDLEATLPQPSHVYDLRTGKYLGLAGRFTFQLDPWQPSLFALLPEPVAEARLTEWLRTQAARE